MKWEIFNLALYFCLPGKHSGWYQILGEALPSVSHLLLTASLRGRYSWLPILQMSKPFGEVM